MQLDISLDKSARRPVARLEWFSGCRALIDTGALFPVWTKSESLLIKLGGKLERNNISFSGFGGKTDGQLYRVNFNLNGLQYIDMPVVVKPMDDLLKVSDEYGKLSVYLAGTYETEVDYQKCK